ncbi:hypothetical protein [Candidatus Electronema sp. JM]|uniref:hypothetical protein n=1 Tax=Candidatus Electronema sp. JM TaxID=3401571 RepID=UPI003AA93A6F
MECRWASCYKASARPLKRAIQRQIEDPLALDHQKNINVTRTNSGSSRPHDQAI